MLGKIHGLENIAFLTEEELLSTEGDPFKIQHAVDLVNDAQKPLPPVDHDTVVDSLNESLEKYKGVLMKINSEKQVNESDKKRLLSLPFYLHKRKELPEPKYGQKEWDMFSKMYGALYNDYENVEFDKEEKITEFNYENYIPETLLKQSDTKSDHFKDFVKMANF